MKKLAVLGGIVVLLIAVIKIGTIFLPSGQESAESQITAQETSQVMSEPSVPDSREPITIEIQNENGTEATTEEFDPAESAAALPTKDESTTPTTSASEHSLATTAAHSLSAKADSVTPMEPKTMYAIKSVNVRKGGSTDSDILGGLTPGKEVKVNGESSNGWYRINYNGGEAFVYKTYLSTNKADVVKETTAAKPTKEASKKPAKSTTAAKKEPAKSTTAAHPATQPATQPAAPAAPTPGGAPANETIAPFPGN